MESPASTLAGERVKGCSHERRLRTRRERKIKLSNFIEGLRILMPYYEGADGFHLGAEHDVVYAYSTNRPLPIDAVWRMVELGWHQDDVHLEEDDEFTAA